MRVYQFRHIRAEAQCSPTSGVSILIGLAAPRGYLLVSGLILQIVLDVLAGVRSYRDVLSSPWPTAAPLEDEDDW